MPTQEIARDPGVQIPDLGAVGRGLQELGAGITDVSERVRAEVERQQKEYDFTQTTKALLAFEDESAKELLRRRKEDDLARPGFSRDFENDLDQRLEAGISSLGGVSDEATERLRLRMQASLQSSTSTAGQLAFEAGRQDATDAADAIVNKISAQVSRDPDSLFDALDQLDDRLGEFKGTLTADQERDRLSGARQDIILSAVSGLVQGNRTQDARLILASGQFDEDLTRVQVAKAQAMIDVGERQSIARAEKAEAATEKALKEAREIQTARIFDDIIEGRFGEMDLDIALDNREIDGKQFIALRKVLAAEENPDALQDDPNIVLDFNRAIDQGTLTRDAVANAFANKQITQPTMDRFRTAIDAGPRDNRTKRQRGFLRDSVAGVSGLNAILSEDQTRKVNQALEIFDERTTGPDKEDPREVRLDIESQAAEPRTLDSLFRPRFMVGVDKETMDIRETKKATARALREGKITPKEAARQVQLIKDIEAARERER